MAAIFSNNSDKFIYFKTKSVLLGDFMAEEQKAEKLGKEIGKVEHYYTHLGVAVVELIDTLKVGDNIKVKGATSDFTQKVESMRIEKDKIQEAKSGQSVGLKVKEHARQHDVVYKV
jgi:translation elongation factor EF-1alpha